MGNDRMVVNDVVMSSMRTVNRICDECQHQRPSGVRITEPWCVLHGKPCESLGNTCGKWAMR